MGYSTNAISGEVLDALFNEVLTPKIYNGQKMGNTWVTKGGVDLFYETTRNDQPDGGICGSVWSVKGYKKGTFKITGRGVIVRFPSTTKEQREKAQSIGMAKFVRKYGAGQAETEGLVGALLTKFSRATA